MRFSSVVWLGVILFAAAMLYSVKFRVQEMDAEVAALRRQVETEKASLQVLQAEWAFLSRPERLRKLADKHLAMVPVGGMQLLDMADVAAFGDGDVMLTNGEEMPLPQQLAPGVIQAGGVGHAR